MSEIKLEAGKYYKTRKHGKAYCAAIIPPSPLEKSEYWMYKEGFAFVYLNSGSVCLELDGKGPSDGDFDIVAEWKEPMKVSGWLNLHKPDCLGLNGFLYETRAEADRGASASRITCIYVTGTEGEEPKE